MMMRLSRLMTGITRTASVLIFLAIAAFCLLLFIATEGALRRAVAPAAHLQSLRIATKAEDVVVGRVELGQRAGAQSAEIAHLRAVHNPLSGWSVGNVAVHRRMLLLYEDGRPSQFARRFVLQEGSMIRLSGTQVTVEAIAPDHLILNVRGNARERRFRLTHQRGYKPRLEPLGASPLWLDDESCGLGKSIFAQARQELAALDRFSTQERRLITIGGGVDCADRIGTGGATRMLGLMVQGDRYSVAPLSDGGLSARLQHPYGPVRSFAQLLWPLEGVRGLILGRTYYTVRHARGLPLELMPRDNITLFLQPESEAVCTDERKADPRSACALREARAQTERRGDLAMILTPLRAVSLGAWSPGERFWSLIWRAAVALAIGAGVAFAVYSLFGRVARQRIWNWRLHRGEGITTALTLGAALSVLIFYLLLDPLSGEVPRALLTLCLLLSWSLATLALLRVPETSPRYWVFWLAISGLIALGSLSAEQLALGAANTRWLGFDLKHMRSLMASFFVITVLLSFDMEGIRSLLYMAVHGKGLRARMLRMIPVMLLVAAFGLWLLFGREEGLGDFQPMEAGKFLAVLFFAITATRLYQERLFAAALTKRALLVGGVLLFALFYAVMFGIIPGLKGDLSPVLILAVVGCLMMVMVGGILRAHRFAQIRLKNGIGAPPGAPPRRAHWLRRPWMETLAIWAGALILILGSAAALHQIAQIESQLGDARAASFSIPEQRVAMYLKPELHPDLGSQLIQSLRLIGQTPCYDEPLCRAPQDRFGPNPAELMRLPAVQDDFALAFFINRFGTLGAVLLASLQVIVLWMMLDASLRAYRWAGGDYADDAARQTLAFINIGGTLMLAAHWTIAWGNAFGAIPIMGQPMTWLSAANSHILFMALPFLMVTVTLMRLPSAQELRRNEGRVSQAPPPYPMPLLARAALRVKNVLRRA
ncbi:MAG: FtsW/RodA/SpoVE family cell cycle protein [Neomegalonema sp.]|nr:FtsW/RodA/SpoVE family cell cycle protein [Neomegalonema sp.]